MDESYFGGKRKGSRGRGIKFLYLEFLKEIEKLKLR